MATQNNRKTFWIIIIIIIIICDPYIFLERRDRENIDTFSACLRSEVGLACITEQTHDIRVSGVCDGARFAVP